MNDTHRRTRGTHPEAPRLLAWSRGEDDASVGHHVQACARCQAEVDRWRHSLTSLAGGLAEEADRVFDETRLATQRASILNRLRGLPRARVIPFPTATAIAPSRTAVLGPHLRRAVAAAALVGLLVGTLAGRFLLDPHRTIRPVRVTQAPQLGPAHGATPGIRTGTAGDEAFLVELDAALISHGPRTLRALDALTPEAR
jgi:hypothetical protein